MLKYEEIIESYVVEGSFLDMPQFPRERINSLVKTFNMYVKFPESRWPEVRKAEEETPEGQEMYEKLKEEFVEKFF